MRRRIPPLQHCEDPGCGHEWRGWSTSCPACAALLAPGLRQGESLRSFRRRMPGYARRKGTLGDVRRMDSQRVSGITHSGRPFSWKRGGDVELLEFGSFNPHNENYQQNGRPWRAT